MSFQSQVYECSAENATVKISNNEWINEFPDGIKLDPGDSVRVLGSFIQEKGGGDEIEIDNDLSLMLEHTPYITAETIALHATDGTTTQQISLSQYAEPAFIVDSFGTEPMVRPDLTTAQGNNSDYGVQLKLPPKYYFATQPSGNTNGDGGQTLTEYTGAIQPDPNFQDNWMNGFGDTAQTVGFSHDALQRVREVEEVFPNTGGNPVLITKYDSDLFLNASVPREFYISTLCKLIQIPLFDGLRYIDTDNTVRTIPFEIDTSNGRTLPFHAGDYVATYFISGMLNKNGPTPGGYELNNQFNIVSGAEPFGVVRYGCGPRSVVGRVLSVIQENMNYTTHEWVREAGETGNLGQHTMSCLKMYVWDWVNPAQIKETNTNKDIPRHGMRTYKRENDYNVYPQSSYLNGNVCGGAFGGITDNTNQPSFQQDRCFQGYLGANVGGPEPGQDQAVINILQYYYQQEFMQNQDDNTKMIQTTANDGLNFLWAGKGTNWNPTTFQADYYDNNPKEACANWATNVTDAQNNVKNYWLCQPHILYYKLKGAGAARAQCHTTGYARWNNVGAICRVNIEDDNVEPYSVQPGYTHFLGVPYQRQEDASNQLTFMQNDRFGSQDIFGLKCANRDKTQAYSATNPKEPFISGLSPNGAPVDIDYNHLAFMPTVGAMTQAKQMTWHLGNYGNDQCCSVYLQSYGGSHKIDKNVNQVYNSDLMIIKKYRTELKLKSGFYNVSELATTLNDQLHYSTGDYQQNVGKFTTVGPRERSLTANPTLVNGNFCMSFIPDTTYGFIPVTENNADNLGLQVNTKYINEIQTVALDGQDTNALQNAQAAFISVYTPPFNCDSSNPDTVNSNTYGNEFTCFRLIGNKLDNRHPTEDTTTTPFQNIMQNRLMECTRDTFRTGTTEYGYRGSQKYTRTYMNAMSYGGASKIFVGSGNPTFSWEENLQKFYFEFLYNPIRPVQSEKGDAETLGAGDATPSVIVNSDLTGDLNAEYGGVYILDLAAAPITNQNTDDYVTHPDNSYFQFIDPTQQLITKFINNEINFMNQIGFTTLDFSKLDDNPYVFISISKINGNVIRNYPDVDISLNGSNPLKVKCTPLQPYNEFFVQVDSNEYLADTGPRLSNTPFYLIGSDLIMSHYHGGKGTKLPVIGICGRNYERFSYVFDLSESAITYRVEQAKTINSIHTHIYTNGYKEANNLFPNSSVIYIIQKQNYAPLAPDPVIQQYQQLLAKQQEQLAKINYQPIVEGMNYNASFQMNDIYEEDDDDEI